MQSDVAVGTNAITGTLAFIEGGLSPAGYLSGDGHFLALKFSTADWADFDKVEVGLDPSQGSGLVDVLPDPDKNMVAKITSTSQKFIVKTTIGEDVVTKEYSLADLVLSPEHVETDFFYVSIFDEDSVPAAMDVSGESYETEYTGEIFGLVPASGSINIDTDTDWTVSSIKVNGDSMEVPTPSEGEYALDLSDVSYRDGIVLQFTATSVTLGEVTITIRYAYNPSE